MNKILLFPVCLSLVAGLSGCGKKPEPPAPEPEVIVQPPSANKASPTPTPSPEPTTTPTPEPTPLPTPEPVADSIQEPLRQVYVLTAFQSVSEIGTHDFPKGAKVNLLAIEGEDYLVEFAGVSVKNNKIFFSETEVLADVPEPTPVPEPETTSTPPAPLPTPEAPTNLTPEDKKIGDLSDKIRLLDEEVRAAKEKAAYEASGDASSSTREVEKLKKERDRLSEELSDIAKP